MIARSARDYRAFLASGRWFGALAQELQEELLAAAALRRLAPGERLFSRGDAPDGLYAIVDGTLRVTGLQEDHKEALLILLEPPAWFGEISIFDGLPRTHDTTAVDEALVVHVPQRRVAALTDASPRWWHALGLLLAGKMRLAFVTMEDAALLPLPVRLARRLVLMADNYGQWSDRRRRVLAVRQEELAAMLSTSRQTANGVLRDLEARGLIKLAYGAIELVDLDGLRRAAAIADDG